MKRILTIIAALAWAFLLFMKVPVWLTAGGTVFPLLGLAVLILTAVTFALTAEDIIRKVRKQNGTASH